MHSRRAFRMILYFFHCLNLVFEKINIYFTPYLLLDFFSIPILPYFSHNNGQKRISE